MNLKYFSTKTGNEYPSLKKEAISMLLFATTYLYESGFSVVCVNYEIKFRSRLPDLFLL